MATKKKTTKKPASNQVYKPHKPFDLDIKTEAHALEMITHLEVLKNTAGWLLMKQIMEGNMAVLERAIITKKLGEKVLTDVEVDDLRKSHSVMEELINKPDQLIEMFKKNNVIGTPTYDPYASDPKQLQKDGLSVGAPMARTLTDE